MFWAGRAATADWPLEQVIAMLRERRAVHGLLAIGSTGHDERNESSDIDLVIVVEAGWEAPRLALSMIEGVVADLLFVQADAVKCWPEPAGFESWPVETLGRWLRSGRILFDRSGLLAEAHDRALHWGELPGVDGPDRYSIWFSINYNLVQNRRMATSIDPVYELGLELRLLYSLNDLWQAYFLLRELPQRGEKEQIRHLQVADPNFLQLFQSALRAAGAAERLAVSEELARRCLDPVGGVWPPGSACVLPWPKSDGNAARAGWEDLLGVS